MISLAPSPAATDQDRGATRTFGIALVLLVVILFHASLVISLRGGVWNRYTFDSVATHGRRGWDFYAVYQAGYACSQGQSVYQMDDADIVVPWHTPYRYLPFMACTLGIAANLLPPQDALIAWVVIQEIVLLACAYASWRLGGGSWRGLLLAGMWLLFTPYYLEVYLGQFSLVQAALLFAFLLAQGWRADLAWGASLIWKHHTGLLAPVFLRRRLWRPIVLGASLVLLSTLPYFWRHPSDLALFVGNFRGAISGAQLGNHGVRQLLYSMMTSAASNLSISVHQAVQGLWMLGVLATNLWAGRQKQSNLVMESCLWATSFFLLYHDIWEHHYVMLLPVLVILYARTGARWLLFLYAALAIWTPYILIDPQGLAAYHTPMRWTPLLPTALDVVYHASKALPALLLWAFIVNRLASPRSLKRDDPEPA